MQLYAGLDLHSTNTYIGILDQEFNRIFKKRVSNNLELILQTLKPFTSICNLVRVHVCFVYLMVFNGVKALDT